MKINVRLLGILLLCVFAFSIVGCFLRRDQDEDEPEDVIAALISANPADGSAISAFAVISLTFDNPPGDVTASAGVVTAAGKTATITGPFVTGALALTITWADGQQVLNYTVSLRDTDDGDEPDDVTTNLVSATPASGSTIAANATITVTFDNPPSDVVASAGVVTVAGKIATITGPFTPGALTLKITWADGQHVLNYTVTAPDVDAPKITDSTITDRDTAVDAEAINTDGRIEVAFNEEVGGVIALQTEAGNDVGWIGSVKGSEAILELVKGKELRFETTYVIAAIVSDAAGNETNVKIIFTTASEPDTDPPEAVELILPGWDGTKVDTETINENGRIEFIFNEEVTGNIILLTEAGDDVGWLGKVEGNKGTLELVKSKELKPVTKYIIQMIVSDAAGNEGRYVTPFETLAILPPPRLEGMVRIPEGEFKMGNDQPIIINGQQRIPPSEQPVHTVYVDAFYIDENEVTNAEYQRFILANPQWQKGKIEGNYLSDWTGNDYPPNKARHPVHDVNWYAAMAYAEWAGKRLPTEAEWEKAGRGKLVGQKYPWGNAINRNRANYNQHVGDTTPVRTFPPNGYGLYDMTGNVWEWCLDEWDPNFYANSPPDNPISGGPIINITNDFTNVTTNRVYRGGSWSLGPGLVRVATRAALPPQTTSSQVGFRCALSP